MRTYLGNADNTHAAHLVEIHDNGELVGLLTHHVKHSPTGISWGYCGSGPADLARSLLIDHLGDRAWCPGCAGSGQQLWDPDTDRFRPYNPEASYSIEVLESVGVCIDCIGERTSFRPAVYQRLKRDLIAPLPETGPWLISADHLNRWLLANKVQP